jgi:predicted O-methyltransferase YrrM
MDIINNTFLMDEYYNNLIKLYENGGGWARFYYGIFSNIINENNFKNCAEVGIGYGFHAKEILTNTKLNKLYLIDPMKYYPNDGFAVDVLQNGGFDPLVSKIKEHLTDFNSKYTWFRKSSITITEEEIPNESLDAVFIDADHSYEAVTQDLNFWWNKLKKGGWMLGDDYNNNFPGTVKAVNEFAEKNNFKMELLKKDINNKNYNFNKDYVIYKFIK